jgi:hypothetical protein
VHIVAGGWWLVAGMAEHPAVASSFDAASSFGPASVQPELLLVPTKTHIPSLCV